MRWLGVNPAIPARRRGEAVRRAMRDALRCGRSLPLELFNPSMQLVATFKDGSEVKFVPDGTVPNSEVH